MIFCKKCFCDSEIVSILDKSKKLDDCPICGAKKIQIYNTAEDTYLEGIFDNLLSVYTAEDDLPESYPTEDLRLLSSILKDDWNIFADISNDTIIDIVKELSPVIAKDYPALFLKRVGIVEKYDLDYLKIHSILRTEKWSDFVYSIKHENRFHTNLINTELLETYCMNISKDILPSPKRYYRGRICLDKEGYKRGEMGAPPIDKVGDGRANSAGISRLYLADDKTTALHEIRAAEYDYVSIGTFKLQKNIKVVDLKKIGNISPFVSDIDCTDLAINRVALKLINDEISRTMRRGDSSLDYVPTQYVVDFIKSITDENGEHVFDGIEYKSAMHSDGYNLTIFYPEVFKCTYCRTIEVQKLKYKTKTVKK